MLSLALFALYTAGSSNDTFRHRVETTITHPRQGEYCLGAAGTSVRLIVELNATHRTFERFDRPTLIVTAPGSHANLLMAYMRQGEPSVRIELNEYPFIGNRLASTTATTLASTHNILYMVRNPFSAYATYSEEARARNVASILSIDDYFTRWRRSIDYWLGDNQTRVVHYEHMIVDPFTALYGLTNEITALAIGRHETSANEIPNIGRQCGRAFSTLSTIDEILRLVDTARLPILGYSFVVDK